MKKDGCYLILVKRPEDTNWVLQTDSDGVEYSKAMDILEQCVRRYGSDQVVISKRMYYRVEVTANPIGMREDQDD